MIIVIIISIIQRHPASSSIPVYSKRSNFDVISIPAAGPNWACCPGAAEWNMGGCHRGMCWNATGGYSTIDNHTDNILIIYPTKIYNRYTMIYPRIEITNNNILYIYIWLNYNDLTATSLGIMVSKGNDLQMALIQVSEILSFTQIYIL